MSNNTVKATLVIQIDVECPECGHDFDLLSDTTLNDEGQIIRQVICDERWDIEPDERLKTHAYCPECSAEFDVKGVIW